MHNFIFIDGMGSADIRSGGGVDVMQDFEKRMLSENARALNRAERIASKGICEEIQQMFGGAAP